MGHDNKLKNLPIYLLINILSNFNTIILANVTKEKPLCPISLAVPLYKNEIKHYYENGSLFHNDILYPPELYWQEDNVTYGCPCEIQPNCIRKCCEYRQVLNDKSECIDVPINTTLPQLSPASNQLADDIRNITRLSDNFRILINRLCLSNVTYKLEPERWSEDTFELQSDGRLLTVDGILPMWQYCMDLHEDLVRITVLICHYPEPEPVTAEGTIYPIGIVLSIPFLLATLIVYAIVPELKNLYGMTLMCYVGCLVVAYCFLAGGRLINYGSPMCAVIDSTSKDGPIMTICCEPGFYYRNSICYGNESLHADEMIFPTIYDESLNVSSMRPDEFIQRYEDPCRYGSFALKPEPPHYDVVYLLENGTILVPNDLEYSVLYPGTYCLASILTESGTVHRVAVCFLSPNEDERIIPIVYPILMCTSTPFLVATFIVYTILPELKSMHGMTLRAYVFCLFVAYVGLATVQLGDQEIIDHDHLCKSMAFIIHFSFLSSFFWLNVMCFDIWWTFGGFRSMQGSVKQRERKKFIIYSIYAWGSATLLTGVCFIMDFVPSVPQSFIKPEFGVRSCWFSSEAARAIYFYGPIGVTVICNICLFVSTTIKIIQHKKDTAHHLKGMDSRRHDDNKQWFNLYLKLFIVMGINWSMEIISWLFNETPQYVWYITDLANTLQGVIIFIIFVWKDKTKRLLLKRLGCQNRSFQSRNSTRSAYHSSASRTCTTMAVTAPLHEKTNPFTERMKTTTTDESDCI